MTGFPTFKGLWPWPWIRSYCIPSCISHRPLPTYQISLKSKKPFSGRTDGRKGGHLRPALLGRLGEVDLIKQQQKQRILRVRTTLDTSRRLSNSLSWFSSCEHVLSSSTSFNTDTKQNTLYTTETPQSAQFSTAVNMSLPPSRHPSCGELLTPLNFH